MAETGSTGTPPLIGPKTEKESKGTLPFVVPNVGGTSVPGIQGTKNAKPNTEFPDIEKNKNDNTFEASSKKDRIEIGSYDLDEKEYHKDIKPKILRDAIPKKYNWKVGDNPDADVDKMGKIVLKGSSSSSFKGQKYPIQLDAKNYFEK